MDKYRMIGQPDVIFEAIQYTAWNRQTVLDFIKTDGRYADRRDGRPVIIVEFEHGDLIIRMTDWVTRNAQGEYSKCSRDLFPRIFEIVP